jgi:dCMP deaminase
MSVIKHSKEKWDLHMLKIAKLCSEMSKDPSTKVGAVISSKKNKILATGYNGFPEEVEDYQEWYEDRRVKYQHIIHAEENALVLVKDYVDINTIYVYPLLPCRECYTILKQKGIKRFVSVNHNKINNICTVCKNNSCALERWDTSHHYREDEDEVILLDLP